GSGIGMHRHENEDEVFIVVRGSGVVDDGRSRARVSAGDATLTRSGEGHAIHNDGDEDLEIVAMILCYADA
ncbi:MAG: cupin domain-containing protein, partial [Lentisphaerae bacterium]|nr:cupin domain-containing protein [Lentisphaerota bacterium]